MQLQSVRENVVSLLVFPLNLTLNCRNSSLSLPPLGIPTSIKTLFLKMIRFFSTIKSVICKLRGIVGILVKLVISLPKRIYSCLSIAIGLINTKLILSPVNLFPPDNQKRFSSNAITPIPKIVLFVKGL